MYIIYNLILSFFLLLLAPLALFKILRTDGFKEELLQRLGIFYKGFTDSVEAGGAVWFHAASVGEVLASVELLEEIRKRWPNRQLIVSTFTATGNKAAIEKLDVHAVIFVPLDFAPLVKRVVRKIRPSLLILMETELWPALITETASMGAAVVLVNGRISDSSFGRYRMLSPLIKRSLSRLSLVLTQSAKDSQRLKMLGVPDDKLHETGNIKFDMSTDDSLLPFLEKDDRPLFIAGSTRNGEEPYILDAYIELKKRHEGLRLLLAPRHIERAKEVSQMIEERDLVFSRRTLLEGNASSQVMLLDTLGELSACYKYADIVFIGGSLVPMGGQNMLEPALYGKPVLFGPHVENFREAAASLIDGGGAVVVQNVEELVEWGDRLLSDGGLSRQMGEKGRGTVITNRGATLKTVDMLASYME